MLKHTNIPLSTARILLLFLIFPTISVWAQQNPMTRAIQQFDKGNFTEAEQLFKTILQEKPDDFMANYFYGASRTENGFFSNTDLNILKKASKEVSPENIDYYLGLQNHALENWEDALKHYNRFQAIAKLNEQEKTDLAKKIEQCFSSQNPFKDKVVEDYVLVEAPEIEEAEVAPSETIDEPVLPEQITIQTDSIEVVQTDSILPPVKTEEPVQEELPQEPTPAPEAAELKTIDFIVNNSIYYILEDNFKTEEGKNAFLQAEVKQKELDFALQKTDELRKAYSQTKTYEERQEIGQEILKYEDHIYTLKPEVNQLVARAKAVENDYWTDAPEKERREFMQHIEELEEEIRSRVTNANITDPNLLLGNAPVQQVVNNSGGDELVYKVQIGAYSRGLPSYTKRLFDKLSLIRKIENYTDENGVVVYTTGNLSRLEDAERMKNQVRQEGVEDAIVVPYFNGKRITLAQAKEISGEK